MSFAKKWLIVILFSVFAASTAFAQQYQIIRAEYGADTRWVDVTQKLKQIASSDSSFRMGNSTFGVDPAPGVVKSLRILVRSTSGGGNRTFEYREGSTVDGAQFSGWNGGDWGSGGDDGYGTQYRIIRAEYGADTRWADVTQQLRRIASTDATFRMGNSTFGIDPAPGVVKTLRILASSPNGNRTFEYREGSTVDGAQFSGWSGGDWGNGGGNDYPGGRGEYRIIRAEYGADSRWADVTQQLRRIASTDATFRMGNSTFGVDPAPGVVKMLRILASRPGEGNRTFEYREGSTVDGAQFAGWSGGDWGNGGGNGYPGGRGEYRIIRAEYGADSRWADVTQQLRRIASTDATFRMGNSTFGIDPAPGVVKMLRILASRPGEGNRTFEYREGSTVDGAQFAGWSGGDWGNGGGWNGDNGNQGDLRIIQAYYGMGNQNVDVTRQLQRQISNGILSVIVGNDSMGAGDPVPGVRKEVTVVYQYRGRERRATVREGDTLNLPQ